MNSIPITPDEMKWVGVDFDGTICHNSGYPDFTPTDPIIGAKLALEALTCSGYKVIIFTARPYSDYRIIESWLEEQGIPFRRIICGKPLLKFMIDDRNIEFVGSWDKVMTTITERG